MSRTYRRMKTERAPRREIRKNKRTWKESRDQTFDMNEMSTVGYLEAV